MKIVLIGFMGSGKSTVALHLSRLLNLELFEMDEEILKLSKYKTIAHLIEECGEEKFREFETSVATQTTNRNNIVISCGGGVVTRPENMRALKAENTKIVFLRTKLDSILIRLEGDKTRPLLSKATEIFDMRQNLYQSYADIFIDTDHVDALEVAKKIVFEIQGMK